MNQMEKTRKIIEEALLEVQRSIQSNDPQKDSYTENQLAQFEIDLKEMLHLIDKNSLPPKGKRDRGMGHVIVDSWDYDSKLGEKIFQAEEEFSRL